MGRTISAVHVRIVNDYNIRLNFNKGAFSSTNTMPDVCIYQERFKVYRFRTGYFIRDYTGCLQIGPFDTEEKANEKIQELVKVSIIPIPPR